MKEFLVILLVGLVLVSCKSDIKVVQYNYLSEMENLKDQTLKSDIDFINVDFKDLFDSVLWDSIVIVGPYMKDNQIRRIKYCNFDLVYDEMKAVANVDWKYGLFFLNDNCFVGFTILSANPSFKFIRSYKSLPVISRSNSVLKLHYEKLKTGEVSYSFVVP